MAEITIQAKRILESVTRVSALSPGAGRLLEVLGRARYEVADIVKVISSDPALTANVLKVVNSAAIGLRREIATVKEAVAFLGDTKIIGIAVATAGRETFNAELAGYHGDRGDLGRHCLWAAVAGRELGRRTDGLVDPGVAFTAGLLHDIGKAVISDHLAEFAPQGAAVRDGTVISDHLDAEHQILGTDHCEVGGALARHWRLPETLVQVIECHHRPETAPEALKPLAYVVHLADTLAMMQGYATGSDSLQYAFAPDYPQFVKLDTGALEALALDVQIDFKATAEALFGEEQETEE